MNTIRILALCDMGDSTLVYMEKTEPVMLQKPMEEFLNEMCMMFGSDVKGRRSASKYLLNVTQRAPIPFCPERKGILFYAPSTDNKTTWIQYWFVEKFRKSERGTSILFKDGTQLTVGIGYRSIKNQIRRCKKLQRLIDEAMGKEW
ncbi:MAG: competence protein ComK [Erysipelotrichaceae bacterium]|nr:competence protein ComK [Erysipelotrichaceae bacterium]